MGDGSLGSCTKTAASHHINRCLDGFGPSSSILTDEASKTADATPSQSACPACAQLIDTDNLELHVEACIDDGRPSSSSQIVETEAIACPSCFLPWTNIDVDDKDQHVVDCLAQQSALLADDGGLTPNHNGIDNPRTLNDTEAAGMGRRLKDLVNRPVGFDRLKESIEGRGQHEPETPGLIPILRQLLEHAFETRTSSPTSTRSAVLCCSNVVHVRSSFGDFGWGCGYKNAQMIVSAIRCLPQYRHLFAVTTSRNTAQGSTSPNDGSRKRTTPDSDVAQLDLPTISEIQIAIEQAWKAGFDPEGALHFKHKLVGSKRWIGTSEVFVYCTWLGIPLTVVDFPKSNETDGTHTALVKWVCAYFDVDLPAEGTNSSNNTAFSKLMQSRGSPIRIAEDRYPLYLQHQGHSRTIIGVEVTRSGQMNLLLFDPGRRVPSDLRKAAIQRCSADGPMYKIAKMNGFGSNRSTRNATVDLSDSTRLLWPFRVSLKTVSRKKEYQILRFDAHGDCLTYQQRQQRRIIASLRVV